MVCKFFNLFFIRSSLIYLSGCILNSALPLSLMPLLTPCSSLRANQKRAAVEPVAKLLTGGRTIAHPFYVNQPASQPVRVQSPATL